jgi:hypothetical protein
MSQGLAAAHHRLKFHARDVMPRPPWSEKNGETEYLLLG